MQSEECRMVLGGRSARFAPLSYRTRSADRGSPLAVRPLAGHRTSAVSGETTLGTGSAASVNSPNNHEV
jgi:hypothetical protein